MKVSETSAFLENFLLDGIEDYECLFNAFNEVNARKKNLSDPGFSDEKVFVIKALLSLRRKRYLDFVWFSQNNQEFKIVSGDTELNELLSSGNFERFPNYYKESFLFFETTELGKIFYEKLYKFNRNREINPKLLPH